VIIQHQQLGETWSADAYILTEESKTPIYESRFRLEQEKAFFYGIIKTNLGYSFLTKKGLTKLFPSLDKAFCVLADLDPANWVSESVFYQIFPDRFKNGNPKLGVKNGEYQFDGGTAKAVEWDTKPLEWDEGRCVDFYNGDLEGIQQSIPYLKELGINAIYLNPIFPSKTHHRYDAIDFSIVDPNLGGDEAFASLMTACHEAGIRLVLDVSINHTGSDHQWFQDALKNPYSPYRDYYYFSHDNEYRAWLGFKTLPQLNYGSKQLRDFIWEGKDAFLKKYLRPPFYLDGWRFDVASQTARNDQDDYTDEVWKAIRKEIKTENAEAYIVGEHWEDSFDHLQGDQWDGNMNYFSCSRIIRAWLGTLDRYIVQPEEYPPKSGMELEGHDLMEGILQNFERLPGQMIHGQFNVLDTHDTPRIHNDKKHHDWERYRGIIFLQFMLPGTPVIYYGDEIALDGHVDTTEGFRYPMEWDKNKWNLDYFEFYQILNTYKKERKELHAGAMRVMDAGTDYVIILRYLESQASLAIINKSLEAQSINIDLSDFNYSQAKEVFSGKKYNLVNGTSDVQLKIKESTLFSLN
jgi:alpha-glucosidase